MDSSERGMNPVVTTILNPWNEYWPSRGINSVKQQLFRPIQIESISRLQNKCHFKTENTFVTGRKHCGTLWEKEKLLVNSFQKAFLQGC